MTSSKKQFPYKSILIACSVNTARSPMAVGFLKKFLSDWGIKNVEVYSGGISSHARDGMLTSLDAKIAMEEEGIILSDEYESIDLKKHRELIDMADFIITLTEKHKAEMKQFKESDGKPILTMKEFAGESGDIEDPTMKGIEGFRVARDAIKECLFKGLENF